MKRSLSTVAVVAAVLLLAGCTAGGTSSRADAGNGGGGQSLAQPVKPKAASGTAIDSESKNAIVQRQLVTTGSLSISVKNPVAAAETATRTVATAGGRIDEQSEQPATDTHRASASLTLRVPSDRLDNTIASLKKLGTVNELTLNANDVTTQVQDTDARVSALQASVDRLLTLMSTATNTKDLIDLESALSSRQADLDSLKAQQAYLKDQVSMSTLTLTLHPLGTVASGAPDSFWGGLVAGWNALAATGAGVLVALGVLLPWLVVLAVIAGVVLLIVRRTRRGKPQSPSTQAARPTPSA